MPQNEYIERHAKLHGRRLDHDERKRKREAREGHDASFKSQNLRGLRAKLYAEKRRKEKIQLKKQIRAHEERNVSGKAGDAAGPSSTPLPRRGRAGTRAEACSTATGPQAATQRRCRRR